MFGSFVRRIFMNLLKPVRALLTSPGKLFKGRKGGGLPGLSLAASCKVRKTLK